MQTEQERSPERDVMKAADELRQLGGGEKAMEAMLTGGLQAIKARRRMALLGVESLLVAAEDVHPLCVDILIREYRRLTEVVHGEAEDWECCTSGNPVADMIARITDLLQEMADRPGVLSGLLVGLSRMAEEPKPDIVAETVEGVKDWAAEQVAKKAEPQVQVA